MKRATIKTSLLCALGLLASCASAPPSPTTAQSFNALAADPNFSPYAMRAVVSKAFESGDLELMSSALWRLCQRSVAVGGNTVDCDDYLDVALIQNNASDQAQANMALYFLTRDTAYHDKAKALLPDDKPYYQQLLSARLEDCLNVTEASEPLALQCYVSGKHFRHEAALKKALTLFEQYGAQHNVADTYYLLARIAADKGQTTQAEMLAARASLLLSQLGEAQKARQVRQWRQDVLHAQ